MKDKMRKHFKFLEIIFLICCSYTVSLDTLPARIRTPTVVPLEKKKIRYHLVPSISFNYLDTWIGGG